MYFEDFNVGTKWYTKGRTITEADIVLFSTLTGAYNPLFLDEEYAKKTRFNGRIAPGLLTASIAVGLTYQLPVDPFGEGFIAQTKVEFEAKKSVKIGDTIRCVVEVLDKKDRGKNGLVTIKVSVVNQNNEEVMTLMMDFLASKKS